MKKTITFFAILLFAIGSLAARTSIACPVTNTTSKTAAVSAVWQAPKMGWDQKIAYALLKKRLEKQLGKQVHVAAAACRSTAVGGCDTLFLKNGNVLLVQDVEKASGGITYSKCGATDGTRYFLSEEKVNRYTSAPANLPAVMLTPEEAKLARRASRSKVLSGITLGLALLGIIGLVTGSGLIYLGLLALPMLLISIFSISLVETSKAPDSPNKEKIKKKTNSAIWFLLLIPVAAAIYIRANL